MIFGQVEQPVGVEGVAATDEIEPELQAITGRALGHLLAGLFGLGDRHAVFAGQMLGLGSAALRGRVRVQLEGPVGDRHVARMAEGGNRALKPALADVTPRAHDVRPDLDIHGSSNRRDHGMIPPQTTPGGTRQTQVQGRHTE